MSELDNTPNDEIWRKILTGEMAEFLKGRHFLKRIPSEPRCKMCNAPFTGIGGRLLPLTLKLKPSKINPYFCNSCYDFPAAHPRQTGNETPPLFSDICRSSPRAPDAG